MTFDRRATLEEADGMGAEDLADAISEDSRTLRAYATKCRILAPIYGKLSRVLQAPEIAIFANNLEKRAREVDEVLALFKAHLTNAKKVDASFSQFLKTPLPELSDAEALSLVTKFDGYSDLVKSANGLNGYFDVWRREEYGDIPHIDTHLEDYISEDTGLSKRLEKIGLGDIFDETNLNDVAFGYLSQLGDIEYIIEVWEDTL